MKKIFTVVTISIIFTTQLFAASKNPFKIFKVAMCIIKKRLQNFK